MYAIEVGDLYNRSRTRWPEGPHLRITSAGIEFVMFMDRPTSSEVRDYKQGPAQWAWVTGKHLGLLCFRFGTQPWSDAPYEAHRESEADRGTPPGNMVHTILVDATTGIVKAQRLLTWSEEFLRAVLEDVEAQLSRPANPAGAHGELQRLYAHDSATLAREHALVRTSGEQAKRREPDTHRNRVNPSQVIAEQLGGMLKPGASYHRPLPAELERWYLYPRDSGHSVLVAVKQLVPDGEQDGDLSDYLVPAPVRTIEKADWRENPSGYLVADLPYSADLGLIVEEEDEEY